MKSGKTHDRQSVSPCTVYCQKYNQAADLIEHGSTVEAVQTLHSLLNDDDAYSRNNALSPSVHHVLIKASIKLATAYWDLSQPEEALVTLNQIFLPNERLYISYGHNLFGEASVIYSIVRNGLRNKKTTTISRGAEFRYLYVGSCLSWTGHELAKLGNYASALILFESAVHEAEKYGSPIAVSSYPFKQLYIQAHLDLTRCHMALGSLSNAKLTLNTLRSSERSLSLTYNHPKFVEMVGLTTALENWASNSSNSISQSLFQNIRGAYDGGMRQAYDGGIRQFPECCYQILCVTQDSSAQVIQSSFRNLSKILHPDKGGDTGLMQRLLLAYGTLRNEDSRRFYDINCKANHSNFDL